MTKQTTIVVIGALRVKFSSYIQIKTIIMPIADFNKLDNACVLAGPAP